MLEFRWMCGSQNSKFHIWLSSKVSSFKKWFPSSFSLSHENKKVDKMCSRQSRHCRSSLARSLRVRAFNNLKKTFCDRRRNDKVLSPHSPFCAYIFFATFCIQCYDCLHNTAWINFFLFTWQLFPLCFVSKFQFVYIKIFHS